MSKSLHTFVVLAYKESQYLEECICSVLNQEYHSNVVIATSTPNPYIDGIAQKYDLPIILNPTPRKGIGCDFDFARTCVDSPLVTVAHQDDIYEPQYSKYIVDYYRKYRDSLILFTDYFEVRNGKKITKNLNLKIKRVLLSPLHTKKLANKQFFKRSTLSFGNAICCPAVTFVNKNIELQNIFPRDLLCNVDWKAWEILSKKEGRFTYITQPLMGHRVHEGSTTSEIIHDNIRTKEDFAVLRCFWPEIIAKVITRFYSLSEKSNEN